MLDSFGAHLIQMPLSDGVGIDGWILLLVGHFAQTEDIHALCGSLQHESVAVITKQSNDHGISLSDGGVCKVYNASGSEDKDPVCSPHNDAM
jgi:hypothetical protein